MLFFSVTEALSGHYTETVFGPRFFFGDWNLARYWRHIRSMDPDLIAELALNEGGKIVFLVLDGLGGLPIETKLETALEAARTPNLDALAAEGVCGLHEPAGAGITPGSGPGHLALFGYDPLHYRIGRGVLTALGIGFDLKAGDVAARGNFCRLEEDGVVSDRRAGRLSTERCEELCRKLQEISIDGLECSIKPVKEHRFLLVLRGDDLDPSIADTDPHKKGRKRSDAEAKTAAGERTADLIGKFVDASDQLLKNEEDANGLLLRGFGSLPKMPQLSEVTRMECKAIAAYPMYRGVARLLGMEVVEVGDDPEKEIEAVEAEWETGDFFFVHIKQTDSLAEDGRFCAKKELLEKVDQLIPRIRSLEPDVLLVTGDHSTPAKLESHSWHPVPALLAAPSTVRPDEVRQFSERAALRGSLGARFPATDLMAITLAHAGRLAKFGA